MVHAIPAPAIFFTLPSNFSINPKIEFFSVCQIPLTCFFDLQYLRAAFQNPNMRVKNTLLFLFLAFALSAVFAQNTEPRCGFDRAEAVLRATQPNYDQSRMAMDIALKEQILRSGASGTRSGDTLVYTIPVVFHVLYLDPSENISTSRILNELTNINEAFRNIGYYDPAVGADARIQFCLTQVAPDGTPHSGIERFQTPLTDIGQGDDFAMKQQFNWDPTRFMNIYVARKLLGGGIAGYAYYPQNHGAFFDGLVLLTTVVGYNKQKSVTAVHEIGHYLGLAHPFDQGCENFDCLLQGDRVCDTPPDSDVTFFEGCVPNNNCTTDADDPSPLNPFTTDVNDRNDLYMDYNANVCGRAFSAGQVERMRLVIPNLRQSLLHSFVCQTPEFYDAGVVEVSHPGTTVCISGDSAVLAIRNFGLVPLSLLEIVVEIDGAVVDTISWTGLLNYQAQAEVAYGLPLDLSAGTHLLRAWGINPSGATDTFSPNDTSALVFNLLLTQYAPYEESFEERIPANWTVVNPNGLGWDLKDRACDQNATDNWSLFLNNQYFYPYGTEDNVLSPLFDLSGQDSVVLSFDYAYAFDTRLSGEEPEYFSVDISTDCGESYSNPLFSGSGQSLATKLINAEDYDIWEPQDCSDWQTIVLPLNAYAGSKFFVRFQFDKYDNGFGLYLDNFRLTARGPSASLEPVKPWVLIAPNPTHAEIRGSVEGGPFEVEMLSLEGKSLGIWHFDASSDFVIDAHNFPAGVYALAFRSGTKRQVQRVILY